MVAAREHGTAALVWTTSELRADREVVRIAVQHGASLQSVARELRDDPTLQSWVFMTRPRRCWRMLREHYLVADPVGSYWYQQTMRSTFASDGTSVDLGSGAARLCREFAQDSYGPGT